MTHTYAILEVSEQTYREVAELLEAKGYGHALKETARGRPVIDMHGLALAVKTTTKVGFSTRPEPRIVGPTHLSDVTIPNPFPQRPTTNPSEGK